ncbi:MAG: DUF86 domain-containing protein [Planctomycetes bacterium]|uniref:HepT-like ribonuclease domain-containing protein n=1 Tax=Candidatus Wunengus sp. YC65 TaxID=3367701 RepID=UPI001DC5AEEE|nr:DUF86 domain-containing protein [Planctomycetota bacterium]
MLISIERIISYTCNIEYNNFVRDYKTQDAVVRNIEIMGEAVKSLSEKAKIDNADIPWKNIAGTRDKLIHDYFGVNIDIVWNIVKNEIPSLLSKIKIVLQNMKEENG